MERRTRAKKPSKISVTHYLNKRVKPTLEESPLEGEEGVMLEYYPLYYYITIRRRTIHRASITGIMLSERDSIESIREIQKEAETIKSICAMYLNDLDRGEVNREIVDNTGISAKDRFTGELNEYIKYWGDNIAYIFNFSIQGKVFGDISKKMDSALNWSGISKDEKSDMAVKPYIKMGGVLSLADYRFMEQNTTHSGRLCLYSWILADKTSDMLGKSYLTRYNIERGSLIEEAWDYVQKWKDFIRRSYGLEKLVTMTREEYDNELVPIIKKVAKVQTVKEMFEIWD